MTPEEKQRLTWIHAALFLLQLIGVALAVGVKAEFSALAPVIGAAQAFFPNPFKNGNGNHK